MLRRGEEGLERAGQPIQVPEAYPALVFQVVASLVVAVIRREVRAVSRGLRIRIRADFLPYPDWAPRIISFLIQHVVSKS